MKSWSDHFRKCVDRDIDVLLASLISKTIFFFFLKKKKKKISKTILKRLYRPGSFFFFWVFFDRYKWLFEEARNVIILITLFIAIGFLYISFSYLSQYIH